MQQSLESQIGAALDRDPRTTHAIMDIVCLGGHVTLTGEVRTAAEKAAAVEIAKRVSGVVTVDDELTIRPTATQK